MKGPAMQIDNLDSNRKLDCSFRVMRLYLPTADSTVLRFDTLMNGQQYNSRLIAGNSPKPKPDDEISKSIYLIKPAKSVNDCMNLRVNKEDLIAALKELVSDLENKE